MMALRVLSVQLAGIRPDTEQTTALGDSKDYVEKERKVALPLMDEAAYLVICRGDDLFTSGTQDRSAGRQHQRTRARQAKAYKRSRSSEALEARWARRVGSTPGSGGTLVR